MNKLDKISWVILIAIFGWIAGITQSALALGNL